MSLRLAEVTGVLLSVPLVRNPVSHVRMTGVCLTCRFCQSHRAAKSCLISL